MRVFLKYSVALIGAIFFSACICSAQTASFSSQPTADAFVTTGSSGSLSSSNFGAAGALAVSASGLPQGEFQSVLKFDLAAAENSFNTQFGVGNWTVQSVTLQLVSAPHANAIFNEIAPGQFGISLMQNNSWVEGTGSGGIPSSDGISYNLLQNMYINNSLDQALGIFNFPGGSSGTNFYSLTLSSGLVSDALNGDSLSLRLFAADSSVSYLFDSRTGGGSAAFHPFLTVNAAVVPEPGCVGIAAAALALSIARFSRRSRRQCDESETLTDFRLPDSSPEKQRL
jgi:hypothetical protein